MTNRSEVNYEQATAHQYYYQEQNNQRRNQSEVLHRPLMLPDFFNVPSVFIVAFAPIAILKTPHS